LDQGDLDRLLAALHKAFDGTAQPVPGQGPVTVWYLEDGFQSSPAGSGLYTGVENDRHPVSETDQAAQLAAAVQLAYCQPAVRAVRRCRSRCRSDVSLRRRWPVQPSSSLPPWWSQAVARRPASVKSRTRARSRTSSTSRP